MEVAAIQTIRPRGRSRFPINTFYYAGLLCLAFLSGCVPFTTASQGSAGMTIGWTDFIQFKGISYHLLTIDQNVSTVKKADLGSVYATVRFQVSGHVTASSYQPEDGDAGYLPANAPVYALKNYQPWFRLAAYDPQEQNRLVIYEVSTNPNARWGRDLFDIAGRVALITLNTPIDSMTEKGRVKTASEINSLVSMILAAPLIPPRQDTSITYLLELHLKDGTIFSRPYRIEADTFDNLALPIDFRISLEVISQT